MVTCLGRTFEIITRIPSKEIGEEHDGDRRCSFLEN